MTSAPTSSPSGAPAPLSRNRDFRWLTASSALSLLGDQFSLIALPWLVLQNTDDTRVLGTVLALTSVPRALFILAGGAIVDRHSPLRILRTTRWLNAGLTGLLALLVLAGPCPLWALYALSLAIGISTAFSIPAATSITPRVVEASQLHAANGVGMGLRQLGMSVGPLLAGLLSAGLGGAGARQPADATGTGVAFALDALSFAVSGWMLGRVRTRPAAGQTPPAGAVARSIGEGLAHAWHDRPLRTCFLYWGLLSVLVMGPTQIALPVLAHDHPQLGAAAFGILVGVHGAGTLAGMALAGALPRLRLVNLGTTLLVVDAVVGLLIAPLGGISAVWQGALLMGGVGLLGGFIQAGLFTWIQQRVPSRLLGRTMALFMFIFMGLQPVAAAATGWLLRVLPADRLFLVCGGTLVLAAAIAAVVTPMRRMEDVRRPLP